MPKVGIDALYVYSPEYYVDNAELALARGNAPKHFTEGVGVKTFSVAFQVLIFAPPHHTSKLTL